MAATSRPPIFLREYLDWRSLENPPQHGARFQWGDGTARAQILIRPLYNYSPAHVQDEEARLATYGGGAEAKESQANGTKNLP